MSYNIEKEIIPGLPNIPLTATNIVVAHESGNPNNVGTDALDNEVAYMTRNWRNAFTSHWVGDGGRIIQLAPTGVMQYGAGHIANTISYAQVELARTDNKEQFEEDYKAYIWILRQLAQEAGIPVTLDTDDEKGIKSHKWVQANLEGTTHTDPYAYLAKFGVSKEQFKKDAKGGEPSSNPSTPKYDTNKVVTVKSNADTYATGEHIADFVKGNEYNVLQDKPDSVLLEGIYSWVKKSDIEEFDYEYKGGSIVEYLDSIGKDSSQDNRKQLAKKYGINGYNFSSEKNLELLDAMRNGKPVSKPEINGNVVLKYSANTYVTGENIPDKFKGKKYTVQQEETNKVLLKELYSWVRKSDVSPAGRVKPIDYRVGNRVNLSSNADTYATGESIPSWAKGDKYTIQQVESNKVLLKELYSWVRKSDLR